MMEDPPMGLIYAELELINEEDRLLHNRGYIEAEKVRSIPVTFLVDSGAYMLTITEHIRKQLGLEKVDEQEAGLADGTVRLLDVVGPVQIRFKNRMSITTAMVIPTGEPLLGAIPMGDMDVIVHPLTEELVVNPENPYIAKKKLK